MSKKREYDFDHTTGEGQRMLMLQSVGMDPEFGRLRTVDTSVPGDYGADPIGDGTFRMVPSGDVVGWEERQRRLARFHPSKEEDERFDAYLKQRYGSEWFPDQ